jgi:hypothetical protein
MGAMMPFMDPSGARRVDDLGCAATMMRSKARPPLWQYFSRLQADESIAAPKGHGPPDSAIFSLQIGMFLGTTTGTTMAIAGPSSRHPFAASGAAVVSEGSCPRWGSTSRR